MRLNCRIELKLLRIRVGILSPQKRTPKRTKTVGARGERLRVDAAKLRKLREDAELSIRTLAMDVGVDPSTVADLEAGRRDWSQLRVIRSIAAHPAIDVDYRELLATDERRLVEEKPPISTYSLAPRSSLDAYVDEERRLGAVEQIKTADGELPLFGATDLVRLFSSPASLAGERYGMRGLIHSMRGLSITDGLVLGISHQDGSRFEVLRRVGNLEKPISLTVMTLGVEHTRLLQIVWTKQSSATMVIRVITSREIPGDEGHMLVTNLEGGQDERRPRRHGSELCRGFTQIEPKSSAAPKPHPWCLVVEAIVAEK